MLLLLAAGRKLMDQTPDMPQFVVIVEFHESLGFSIHLLPMSRNGCVILSVGIFFSGTIRA